MKKQVMSFNYRRNSRLHNNICEHAVNESIKRQPHAPKQKSPNTKTENAKRQNVMDRS